MVIEAIMEFASQKMSLSFFAVVLFVAFIGTASSQTPSFKPTVEEGTDRPGGDYHDFRLAIPSAGLCQMACAAEAQCRAWAYVNRPGDAHCWLKGKVPPAQKVADRTSGVVRPDGSAPPGPSGVLQLAIRSAAPNVTRCVDIANAKFTQGMRLQLWDCNSSSAQLFSYELGSRHLTIGNLCAQVVGNGERGSAVVLNPCGADASHSWNMAIKDGHAQLVGMSGLCLDTGGHFENGTPLQIWDCNGTAAQRWDFTRVKGP